jgi:hypothetical protein
MVTAVIAHLRAEEVHERLGLLRAVSPRARFVVCYAGTPDEFERIELEDKVFVDDPTLRGPEQHLQSLTSTFEALWGECFESDGDLDSLYVIEYDHLVLDPSFEDRLRELACSTGAHLLGKNGVERTATNDEHYIRFRSDVRLLAHLRLLSVREDPRRMFGCLGDGIWISRPALQAYVEVREHPLCYCETYVPTLVHHLGYRVVDVDAHGSLYRHVRWVPPYDAEQAVAAFRDGTVFMHPVKDRGAVRAVREAVAAADVTTAPAESVASSADK